MVASELILKEFSVSKGREFLTQLYVLIFTVVITAFVEAQVFGICKSASKVFGLKHRGCLRSASVSLIFMFAGSHLRSICISTDFRASPWIDFVFRLRGGISFLGNNIVAFKARPWLWRNFLSLCQLLFLRTFIDTFGVLFVVIR
jgi:hypothetical protein